MTRKEQTKMTHTAKITFDPVSEAKPENSAMMDNTDAAGYPVFRPKQKRSESQNRESTVWERMLNKSERQLAETAAERDSLRLELAGTKINLELAEGTLNAHKNHLTAADRALSQAREQVKTLLAACRSLRIAFAAAVPPSKMREAWRPAWNDAEAAIKSVESEQAK